MANPLLIIGLVLSAASIVYNITEARRLRKEARRRADEAAGIEVRVTPSGKPVPIALGYCAAPGLLAYAQTSPRLPASPATLGDQRVGRFLNVNLAFGALYVDKPTGRAPGKFREFLMAQYVLAAAGVDELVDLYVDEIPWNSGVPDGLVSQFDYLPPASSMAHRLYQGVAGTEASEFTTERDGNSRGTGLARLDSFYRFNPTNPLFYDVPRVLAFLKGQQSRAFVTRGSSIRVSGRGFSSTTPRVLLEYMTDSTWGLGFPDTDFDLTSWRDAYENAVGASWTPRTLWRSRYPAELNTLNGTTYDTWSQYFLGLGFRDIQDTGLDAWHKVAIRDLHRYETNGLLKRPGDKLESLLAILSTMPGAMLYRSFAGRWKLNTIPATVNTGQTAAQASVGTIDAHMIRETPSKAHPNTSERLNRLTIKFNNLLKDFAQDTVTWPPPGSTAARTLMEEDGGLLLADEFELELSATPYHAMDIAHAMVMQSRRPR